MIDAMVKEIGEEHIRYNTHVKKITNKDGISIIQLPQGEQILAGKTLFTGSLGVIKAGKIEFDPPPEKILDYSKNIKMAHLGKIIFEVDKDFLKDRPDLHNLHINILEGEKTSLAHVSSAGKPLITLFVGGEEAKNMENMPEAEIQKYFLSRLSGVKELKG